MATRSGRLTKNDIKTIRREVFPAAAKYYDLGIELGLDPDYLNTLTSKSDEENLRELLIRWLSGIDPEPTWKALCDALCSPAVKQELLAEEIEEKYCKKDSKNAQEDNNEVVHTEQSTDVHTGDHEIVSTHSISTPTIESASLAMSTRDSPSALKSSSESSTKPMTSTVKKSPRKVSCIHSIYYIDHYDCLLYTSDAADE